MSATTVPSTLPDDPYFFTTYGSEVYNAVLVKGLADRGHQIGWYAPIKSTTFHDYNNIEYYPTVNSEGQHLVDERLEKISYRPAKTTDLLDYDFVIDMSKQNHITEELYYHDFRPYLQYKSGYQDWTYPRFGSRHFVTHCETFADNFVKNGQPRPDVCRFGIPTFWNHSDKERAGPIEYEEKWLLDNIGGEYYLYPHRPSWQKGFEKLVDLARAFPEKTFIISTAAIFLDHIREMEELRKTGLRPNLKIIDVPKDIHYHYYRRTLLRNAAAVLSPFTTKDGYMDTGGLISFEAIRCGCPVIVTRSPGSTEMLGSLDGNGVEFVDDGNESLKQVVKRGDLTRPKVDDSWMSVDSFVDDYLRVMEKYK